MKGYVESAKSNYHVHITHEILSPVAVFETVRQRCPFMYQIGFLHIVTWIHPCTPRPSGLTKTTLGLNGGTMCLARSHTR